MMDFVNTLLLQEARSSNQRFKVGEVLDLVYEDVLSRAKIRKFTGLCISVKKAGFGFRYILRNVFSSVSVEFSIDANSTVVVSLTKAPIYKKVSKRKAKLFYLRKKRIVDSKV